MNMCLPPPPPPPPPIIEFATPLTETVFSLLNKINTNKSNGPDKIPNWVFSTHTS